MRRVILLLIMTSLGVGCIDKNTAQQAVIAIQGQGGGPKPDVPPMMRNRELPFRYPAALYEKKVQGNVTLHIRIDSTGAVVADSTQVVKSSGVPALDSAAVNGSRFLDFVPAKLKGRPIAVSVQLPVYYRHPQGAPFPADSSASGVAARKQP